LQDSGSVDLEIINRMYLQNSFHVLDDFHSVARKSFGLDTREIDFRENSEGARTIINNWIQNKTKNKITEMIGPGTCASRNSDNVIAPM
jgi:serine protease inhibitor